MTAIAQQTDAFINAKPYRLGDHHRTCSDPVLQKIFFRETNPFARMAKNPPTPPRVRLCRAKHDGHLWVVYPPQTNPFAQCEKTADVDICRSQCALGADEGVCRPQDIAQGAMAGPEAVLPYGLRVMPPTVTKKKDRA